MNEPNEPSSPPQPSSSSQALKRLLLTGVEDKASSLPAAHLGSPSTFSITDVRGLCISSILGVARESKDRQGDKQH